MIQFDEPLVEALEEQRATVSVRARGERYLALLDARPGERILDVGCGGGWLSRALEPRVAPGGQVVAVDRSRAAIDLAVRLSAAVPPGSLRFDCLDAQSLPFADGTFDAASCISVLAFCEEPERVLAELRRVLHYDGRLMVASSDEDTRLFNTHDIELGRRVQRAIANRGRHPWIGRRLAHLLVRAGFRLTREVVLSDVERHFRPGMAGFTLAHAFRPYLITDGGISAEDYDCWLADLRACEWEGAYCYSVTTFAYLATHERSDSAGT